MPSNGYVRSASLIPLQVPCCTAEQKIPVIATGIHETAPGAAYLFPTSLSARLWQISFLGGRPGFRIPPVQAAIRSQLRDSTGLAPVSPLGPFIRELGTQGAMRLSPALYAGITQSSSRNLAAISVWVKSRAGLGFLRAQANVRVVLCRSGQPGPLPFRPRPAHTGRRKSPPPVRRLYQSHGRPR